MKRFIRVYPGLSAIFVTLVVSGCAELHWRKDGADAAALERDLMDCRSRAARLAGPALILPSDVVGVDERGRAVMGRAGRLDTERLLHEHDLTGACMREKGYELAPAAKDRDP